MEILEVMDMAIIPIIIAQYHSTEMVSGGNSTGEQYTTHLSV